MFVRSNAIMRKANVSITLRAGIDEAYAGEFGSVVCEVECNNVEGDCLDSLRVGIGDLLCLLSGKLQTVVGRQ